MAVSMSALDQNSKVITKGKYSISQSASTHSANSIATLIQYITLRFLFPHFLNVFLLLVSTLTNNSMQMID